MFSFGKKKKVIEYLEKEILRLSLGCQKLLKDWQAEDYEKYGDLSPELLNKELEKFYAGVNASLIVEVKRDFSPAIGEKLSKQISDFSKSHPVTGEYLFLFAYSSIMNQLPSKDVEQKGAEIGETQLNLCKATTASVLKGKP